jgi:predicted nucleic acid-binding Zn ribbon protein
MPIREYECGKCLRRIERVELKAREDKPECCGRETVQLTTSASIAFKGDGWARDGYSSRRK